MSDDLAFVGDVHGNSSALRGIVAAVAARGAPHIVFLGDYINKGQESAAVMEQLISLWRAGHATLLRGNHEAALLEAITNGELRSFLKMGGAMTIRAYVAEGVGPDVLTDFRAKFPQHHLEALRLMRETYETETVVAQHAPNAVTSSKFSISAHVPVGDRPRIGRRSAQLDTGCGSESGRLTALLWPSLDYVQVDARGALVR